MTSLFQRWFKSRELERRETRRAELAQIEHLETRLCLGSLTSPDLGDWDADLVEDLTEVNEVTTDIFGDETEDESGEPTDWNNDNDSDAGSSQSTADVHVASSAVDVVSMGLVDPSLETAVDVMASSSTGEELTATQPEAMPPMILQASENTQNQQASGSATTNTPPPAGISGSVTVDQPDAGGDTGNASISPGNSTANAEGTPTGDQSSTNTSSSASTDSSSAAGQAEIPFAFTADTEQPIVVKYDFRDQNGFENQITAAQQEIAEQSLAAWSAATDGRVVFEHDTSAPDSEIVNIGTGDLAAFGHSSGVSSVLAVGGGILNQNEDGVIVSGVAWMDASEQWDTTLGNGNAEGYDYFTVVTHEIGHTLGLGDSDNIDNGVDVMVSNYQGEIAAISIEGAELGASVYSANSELQLNVMLAEEAKLAPSEVAERLTAVDVEMIVNRGAVATPTDDAIIAVVDRQGRILGVRVEQGVLKMIDANPDLPTELDRAAGGGVLGNGMIDAGPETETLVFAIDGAVAKARTAAFFANGTPDSNDGTPITSRLIRFISQSTITQREVEGNPSITDPDSTIRGPGVVAPIGLGGHFPPEINFTPHVDLFAIEKTNRDSLIHPGEDGIKGDGEDTNNNLILDPGEDINNDMVLDLSDDILLRSRFNVDPSHIPMVMMGGVGPFPALMAPPESFGVEREILPNASPRGIATLPGGVPLFRDSDGDGIGDTLLGGVGTFFPGPSGFATYEQTFDPATGMLTPLEDQTEKDRTNAPLVLESEFISVVAAGLSQQAVDAGLRLPACIDVGLDGQDLDIPFDTLSLVGINLEAIGDIAGIQGLKNLANQFVDCDTGTHPLTGITNESEILGMTDFKAGLPPAEGWLVLPHDSGDLDGDGLADITAADVRMIVQNGVDQAELVRAAIRLPVGTRTSMVLSVADRSGEVLGLFRMDDATIFSIDVAVTKARNTAYYADTALPDDPDHPGIQLVDQVDTVPRGAAFTNRTFRYLVEARFPSGVETGDIGDFSILNTPADGLGNSIDPATALNVGDPLAASSFDTTVGGFDTFNLSTNFRDPGDSNVVAAPNPFNDGKNLRKANQSGVVFFPGSTPIYNADGELIGGFGVSGDGVDQDDVVTFAGAQGFLPPDAVPRADEVTVQTPSGPVYLPFMKFLRNPLG